MMRIKQTWLKKWCSILLICFMLVGQTPMHVYGEPNYIEVEDYSVCTHVMKISFHLQYTQPLDIEVWVDGNRFGYIMKDEELEGYDGAMQLEDHRFPCNLGGTGRRVLPAPMGELKNAGEGPMVTDVEISYIPRETVEEESLATMQLMRGETKPEGETGYYELLWDGRVAYDENKNSLDGEYVTVGEDPKTDFPLVSLRFQPLGYPGKNVTPTCHTETTSNEDGTETT